jgi:hypothetical protein
VSSGCVCSHAVKETVTRRCCRRDTRGASGCRLSLPPGSTHEEAGKGRAGRDCEYLEIRKNALAFLVDRGGRQRYFFPQQIAQSIRLPEWVPYGLIRWSFRKCGRPL